MSGLRHVNVNDCWPPSSFYRLFCNRNSQDLIMIVNLKCLMVRFPSLPLPHPVLLPPSFFSVSHSAVRMLIIDEREETLGTKLIIYRVQTPPLFIAFLGYVPSVVYTISNIMHQNPCEVHSRNSFNFSSREFLSRNKLRKNQVSPVSWTSLAHMNNP